MTENRIFTLCRMITWVVFLRMFWNFITSLPVKRGGFLSFLTIFTFAVPGLLDLIWRNMDFYPMSYHNLSSVSQNVLKFYPQLTGEERRVPFIFGRTISNVLVMEIGWTYVGSGGYILVSCAHSNTSLH
jgi:hypothetical protein